MIIKQSVTNKRSVGRLVLSALGVSALLTISGCSSGDNTAATDEAVDSTAPITEVETAVVEEIPEAEPVEVIEPVDETPAPAETSVDAVEVVSAAEPEVLAADAGAKLYEAQCKVCHQNGLLNAPKYGDTAAWSTRITKDRETLYVHSAQGFNKMPAQVNDNVSEAQVHAAVDYMLEAVS
ncbi:c-type cytochrome [Psychrobacter sp. 72-O-c]|uniref:c-type cytochrome n=1 Tax=Psychrobacter sp. 72-O-c TaxID=2774125 RepID=UPI00191ADCF2|nr:c-type cytochrome [Psychrobacter sp. 72-O-c]